MYGDARIFKSIVAPRRNYSLQRVEKYLTELEKSGLIVRYQVNGNQFLLAPNFEKHQTGLRKDKEAPSRIPPPGTELLRSKDGLTPDLLPPKRREVKDKEKGSIKESGDTLSHLKYGEFENVLLSEEEYEKLTEKIGKPQADDLIEQLSGYMAQNPKNASKYKDHYAVILNWARRDSRGGAPARAGAGNDGRKKGKLPDGDALEAKARELGLPT